MPLIYECDRCESRKGARDGYRCTADPLGQMVLCEMCAGAHARVGEVISALNHIVRTAWWKDAAPELPPDLLTRDHLEELHEVRDAVHAMLHRLEGE